MGAAHYACYDSRAEPLLGRYVMAIVYYGKAIRETYNSENTHGVRRRSCNWPSAVCVLPKIGRIGLWQRVVLGSRRSISVDCVDCLYHCILMLAPGALLLEETCYFEIFILSFSLKILKNMVPPISILRSFQISWSVENFPLRLANRCFLTREDKKRKKARNLKR